MRPLHRVLFGIALCIAFSGVQACATETPGAELNPQPLPPEDKKDQNTGEETRAPGEFDSNGGATGAGGGSSSGSSSSSGGPPAAATDGGDAGTDSGGDN